MTNQLKNLGNILSARRHSKDLVVTNISSSGIVNQWTCKEIEDGANAVASFLQQQNFEYGSRIGIFATNSVQYIMAYIGIMRCGCVCVPINTKQPLNTIKFICSDADIQFAFVDEVLAEVLPTTVKTFSLQLIHTLKYYGEVLVECENDTALILYTSGSTGRPKGVVLSHASQLSMITAYTSGTSRKIFFEQRGIVVAPMFHMNALVFIKSFLYSGGSIVLMSKFEHLAFANALEKYKVNVITGVPTMIAIMHKEKDSFAGRDLSSVKTVYIGSAPVTEAIVKISKEMMPKAEVLNSYGTTEIGGGLFGAHPKGLKRPPTSVGFPGTGIQFRFVKGTRKGVLEVRSPSSMTRYLNLPKLTAEKFKDGWFNTGDIFRIDDDGFYYFVGRADDMFVCAGENIYPGEVEKAIETIPGVVESVVVPVKNDIRGEMPVAFVVSENPKLTEDMVQQQVKNIAAVYLYPRRVWFLDSMPLASTNKIDRKKLTIDANELMASSQN